MERKNRILVSAIAIGLILSALGVHVLAQTYGLENTRVYGPYQCASCLVSSPVPDPATSAYIDSMDSYNFSLLGFIWKRQGDSYIICNATYCTTYSRTYNGGFAGTGRVRREHGLVGGGGNVSGGASTGGIGIVGYTAVYKNVQTCTPSGCSSQMVLIGYQPVYGNISTRER